MTFFVGSAAQVLTHCIPFLKNFILNTRLFSDFIWWKSRNYLSRKWLIKVVLDGMSKGVSRERRSTIETLPTKKYA